MVIFFSVFLITFDLLDEQFLDMTSYSEEVLLVFQLLSMPLHGAAFADPAVQSVPVLLAGMTSNPVWCRG